MIFGNSEASLADGWTASSTYASIGGYFALFGDHCYAFGVVCER